MSLPDTEMSINYQLIHCIDRLINKAERNKKNDLINRKPIL